MWNRQSKNTNIYHVLIILSHFSPRLSKHPLTSTNKSLPVVVLLTECIAASSSIIANIYVVPVAVLDITALVLSPGGKSSDWSSRFPTTSSIHLVYSRVYQSLYELPIREWLSGGSILVLTGPSLDKRFRCLFPLFICHILVQFRNEVQNAVPNKVMPSLLFKKTKQKKLQFQNKSISCIVILQKNIKLVSNGELFKECLVTEVGQTVWCVIFYVCILISHRPGDNQRAGYFL